MCIDSAPHVVSLLEAELSRLRDASHGAWHSYFTWFTWFFTTQTAVLGWIVVKEKDVANPSGIVILAVGLLVLNLLGVGAAVRQRVYSKSQERRTDAICARLSAHALEGGVTIEITSGFSHDLTHSALGVFIGALFFGAIMCLVVSVRYALLAAG